MLDVTDKACAGECPAGCIDQGERALYARPDERVECGTCEPACPAEATFCQDDEPGQRASPRQRTPASPTRSARPKARPRPGRCPTTPAMPPAASPAGSGTVPGPGYSDGSAPAGQAADGRGRARRRGTRAQIARPSVLPAGGATGPADGQVTGMRFRLEVRFTPASAGQRVVIRWRRLAPGDGDQIADVLGILEDAGAESFAVRTSGGELVLILAGSALAGKVIPPPARRRSAGPAAPDRGAG